MSVVATTFTVHSQSMPLALVLGTFLCFSAGAFILNVTRANAPAAADFPHVGILLLRMFFRGPVTIAQRRPPLSMFFSSSSFFKYRYKNSNNNEDGNGNESYEEEEEEEAE
jgi:hypothetical protein